MLNYKEITSRERNRVPKYRNENAGQSVGLLIKINGQSVELPIKSNRQSVELLVKRSGRSSYLLKNGQDLRSRIRRGNNNSNSLRKGRGL